MLRKSIAIWLDQLDSVARPLLVGLVISMLALGLVYSLYLGNQVRYWDEREYWDLAQRLVSLHEFGFEGQRAFRPPFYPAFLSFFVAAGLPLWVARFANFAFLAGTMVLLFRAVSRFTRPAAGLTAAGWVFAYPVLIYAAGTLYPQTLAGFLLSAVVEAVTDESSKRAPLRAGIAYGMLILTVPTFAPLLAVLLGWMLWRTGRAALPRAACIIGLAALPVVAWGVRNSLVLGHWVLLSTNSGLNLLVGNSPNTTADSGVNVDLSYLPLPPGLDEVEASRYYQAASLRWIREHPGQAFALYWAKLAHYFAVSDQLATAAEASAAKRLALGVTYAPLLAVLAGRCVWFRRFRWSSLDALLVVLYLTNGCLAAVFFTRVRFRIPFDLLLIALLAGTLAQLASLIQPKGPARAESASR
jgi:hypothetical protein